MDKPNKSETLARVVVMVFAAMTTVLIAHHYLPSAVAWSLGGYWTAVISSELPKFTADS